MSTTYTSGSLKSPPSPESHAPSSVAHQVRCASLYQHQFAAMAQVNGTQNGTQNGTHNGIQNGNGNGVGQPHTNGNSSHMKKASRKLSSPMMPAFMVSAPGKVIVFGEHAVVHGKVSAPVLSHKSSCPLRRAIAAR